VELCPKNKKKNGRKIWGFGGAWVFGEKEKKMGKWGSTVEVRWRCEVMGSGGKVVLVDGCDGEKRNDGEDLYGAGESGEKRRNSDLKAGHVRAKNECD
jgi:hypothetical protein